MISGTYSLIVHVPYSLAISVGGLGNVKFKSGYYAYIGSAMGGLEKRIGRHLSKKKKIYWHIDHLLLHARAVDVITAPGKIRKECEIAEELAKRLPYVDGFGSSDCTCRSHLFYSSDLSELITHVLNGFRACGLKPEKGIRYGQT
ncbi:MAG: GIY-YIG nuclease family protein [Hadesarchaea archaeon]|nr:MAG: GIY-YIG nuclease family protein [Hadesarchaea archaeon]HDI12653.1 GIY-YIG nuclease family protein [Hadesarchaea archaeon]